MTSEYYAGHDRAEALSFSDRGFDVLCCEDLWRLDPPRVRGVGGSISSPSWERSLAPGTLAVLAGPHPFVAAVGEAGYVAGVAAAALAALRLLPLF